MGKDRILLPIRAGDARHRIHRKSSHRGGVGGREREQLEIGGGRCRIRQVEQRARSPDPGEIEQRRIAGRCRDGLVEADPCLRKQLRRCQLGADVDRGAAHPFAQQQETVSRVRGGARDEHLPIHTGGHLGVRPRFEARKDRIGRRARDRERGVDTGVLMGPARPRVCTGERVSPAIVVVGGGVRERVDELIAEEARSRGIAEVRALEVSDRSVHQKVRVLRHIHVGGEDLRGILLLQ
jgi:hypothetical protein